MTLNLTIPQNLHTDFTPRITVIGVGGGGTNAVDNMIAMNLQGVEFVVANTDAQQLMHSRARPAHPARPAHHPGPRRRRQARDRPRGGRGGGRRDCTATSKARTWCSSPPAWAAAPAPARPR